MTKEIHPPLLLGQSGARERLNPVEETENLEEDQEVSLLLTRGFHSRISLIDYELVSRYNWYRNGDGYIIGKILGKGSGSRPSISLHRLISGARKGEFVDHKNHDPSDNRRSNLRICTHSQNLANSLKRKGTSSRFKGVTWSKKYWLSYIFFEKKRRHLGCFKDEIEAAKAYNNAAVKYFGEFAVLNQFE